MEEKSHASFSQISSPLNPTILLGTFDRHGERGLPLWLIYSHLTNRYQNAVVNCAKSKKERVACKVLQGLTLGPFLIFFV